MVSVPKVKLNNGVMLPALAAGTWQYKPDVAEQSVKEAFEAGFTHIDTAHDYDIKSVWAKLYKAEIGTHSSLRPKYRAVAYKA